MPLLTLLSRIASTTYSESSPMLSSVSAIFSQQLVPTKTMTWIHSHPFKLKMKVSARPPPSLPWAAQRGEDNVHDRTGNEKLELKATRIWPKVKEYWEKTCLSSFVKVSRTSSLCPLVTYDKVNGFLLKNALLSSSTSSTSLPFLSPSTRLFPLFFPLISCGKVTHPKTTLTLKFYSEMDTFLKVLMPQLWNRLVLLKNELVDYVKYFALSKSPFFSLNERKVHASSN